MPEKQVTLDRNLGVTIEIVPAALEHVGYEFFLFDSFGGNPRPEGNQPGFISDQDSDSFDIDVPTDQLHGFALKWRIDILTATNSGAEEEYNVIIRVKQNGQIAQGGVIMGPPEKGKFTTATSFFDFVRFIVP